VEDIAILRAMPNMVVVAPADGVECRLATLALTDMPGPAYLRLTRDATPVIFGEDYRFVFGKAVTLREGTDITIFGTGVQSVRALEACDLLAGRINAHLVHVHAGPIDIDRIVRRRRRVGPHDRGPVSSAAWAGPWPSLRTHADAMKILDCRLLWESGANNAILEVGMTRSVAQGQALLGSALMEMSAGRSPRLDRPPDVPT
jgi:hypothetical protein